MKENSKCLPPLCKRGQGGLNAETIAVAGPPKPLFAKGETGKIIFLIDHMCIN